MKTEDAEELGQLEECCSDNQCRPIFSSHEVSIVPIPLTVLSKPFLSLAGETLLSSGQNLNVYYICHLGW